SRRAVLSGAAALSTSPLWPRPAKSADWRPNETVRIIVPAAPGGSTDVIGRYLAQHLQQSWGVTAVVENKSGGGGTIGTAYYVQQKPDGNSILVGNPGPNAVAYSIFRSLPYKADQLQPVSNAIRIPNIISAHPSSGIKSIKELITYLKANPDKLNYGSAGTGTTHHLAGELFKIVTKTRIQHVPYRGAGPAMQDLVAGHVPLVFDGLGSSAPQIRSGQLRALAVAAPKRVAAFPDVPTAAEAGVPGYEVSTWYGVFAPKKTPPAVVERMTKELQKAMQTAAIKEAWERNGSDVPDVTGPAFGAMVAAETVRWQKVVTEAGVKLD
ncbi:MAG TPA: ABC transporter substrate-binding protein, partial [Afipia sp.]|nr:ABC transporter substrate-binding protein [Afipia sp.]